MTEFMYFFAFHPGWYTLFIAFLSLFIGSFLNVVIARLPIMMKREWEHDCREFFNLKIPKTQSPETFNLFWPRSHCPECKHTLRWWENIPIISFIFLSGHCSHCHKKISYRYPIVEAITVILSALIAWNFGLSIQGIMALILTWGLIVISFIDLDHQFIPDNITMPLLWIGLLMNLHGTFTNIENAIWGVIVGYLSLWLFTHLYKLSTGKIGMGHGDFKLLALFGAWLGWQVIPFIILFSSIVGALIGILLIIFKNFHRDTPIPFGPYLAFAGWLALLWGNDIINWYLTWIEI